MSGVLIDTSVWVSHFRQRNLQLESLLLLDAVCVHPFVLGELACGTPPRRAELLSDLARLRSVQQPTLAEVMALIEREKLFGLGCGIVDLTLLAATRMSPGTRLWTLDLRLHRLAQQANVHFSASH